MRRFFKALLLALCIAAIGGCMETAADDLYALPQLSEEYLRLQSAIDSVLASGARYGAPASGSNRQPIQQEDIDGDGEREVLAFFNVTGSDRPLKIIIYQSRGEDYTEIARIEGEGSGVESVSYLDMDADGIREIAVGWQIGPGINMLSVYSMKGWQVNKIVETNYSQYAVCDLDSEPGREIAVLRLSQSDLTGEMEHYSLTSDGEVLTSTARLTDGIGALERVRSTALLGGENAILVESSYANGLVTDILVHRNGKLENITLTESGRSEDTMRSYKVYCRDINGDGILDVPRPVPLPATSETTYYMLEWYSYYGHGASRLVSTTYNNYTDSWYLVIPRDWIGNIALSREEGETGERMIVFSTVSEDGGRGTDIAVIYTLTGDDRYDRARTDDRFILLEEEETIYAGKILPGAEKSGLPVNQDILKANFGFIYSEWITGEM